MTSIHTIDGNRQPDRYHQVLPHEHVFCDFYRVTGQASHVLNELELAVAELERIPDVTATLLVELTTASIGRDPRALLEVSERTGLDIVMAAGWYRGSYFPPEIESTPTDALASEIVRELTIGVESGDRFVRAGIIGEVGTDLGHVSPAEERVFRAAARASTETGAPVTTHAMSYPVGLQQAHLLLEEGCDPSRIIIGHADSFLNRDYHRALLDKGVWVQFDTCGRTHLNPDAARADHLMRLIHEGFGDQLLISSDRCFRGDLAAFGGAGYAWTVTGFAELLRERGADDATIDTLTRANPLRALAW